MASTDQTDQAGPGMMTTLFSSLSTITIPKAITVVPIGIAIILYVFSLKSISSYLNNPIYIDNWQALRPTIWKIIGLSAAGSFLLYIVSLLYFIQDSSKITWFLIIMSFVTVFLSFLALTLSTQPLKKQG